jgi:hypothetical protein
MVKFEKILCKYVYLSEIMACIVMQDIIRINLRYSGPEVDSGEMDINEVVAALQGFSSAYAKVSSKVAPEAHHQLKVTAIRESSFDLFIVAAILLTQSGDLFEQIKLVSSAAKYTFQLITEVINVKKHAKSQPCTTRIDGSNNNITVINAENVELSISLPAFEMYRDKVLDADVSKIIAPLCEGKINTAQLKEDNENGAEVCVNSSEQDYFRQSSEITKAEKVVIGTLVSLNKETNRGTFKFGNGNTIRYAFIGEDKDRFHLDFAHKGPVRVVAIVEFDENLTPLHLDIKNVEAAQIALELAENTE